MRLLFGFLDKFGCISAGRQRANRAVGSLIACLLGSVALSCVLLTHTPTAHAFQAEKIGAKAALADEAAYDPKNPFARIIRGELHAYKVYEDKHVLAFLSLDQKAPGHVLVISKTSQAQNILEISPQELTRVMLVAQRIARAEVRAVHADGVVIKQNNGDAAGQSVFHLHVHVIPQWQDAPPEFPRNADGKIDRKAIAARIVDEIGR